VYIIAIFSNNIKYKQKVIIKNYNYKIEYLGLIKHFLKIVKKLWLSSAIVKNTFGQKHYLQYKN